MSDQKNEDGTIGVSHIQPGKNVKVRATISSLRHHRIRNGNLMTDAIIGDATGSIKCVWFSKSPLGDLKIGNEYIFEGHLENKYGRLALQKPRYVLTQENQRSYEPVQPSPQPTVKPYLSKRSWWDDIDLGGVIWILIIIGVAAYFIFNHIHNQQLRASGVTCKDVTSIDYNWNNDVLCTNPDGTTFYTNYAGGNKYGYNFPN
jgi:hypothetical protein